MNSYLSAIGFSKIKSLHQLDQLHRDVMKNPDHRTVTGYSLSHSCVQLDKSYGSGIGLSLIGEMDSSGSFLAEHAFPCIAPGPYTFTDDVILEERVSVTGFSGVLDNVNLSVIFYVQNIAYVNGLMWNNRVPNKMRISLNGLSIEGSVLIPLNKSEQEREYDLDKRREEMNAIRDYRNGNDTIYDLLLLKDMDRKDAADRRLQTEDVLSIVDTSIIPYGTECDIFDLIGTIVAVNMTENSRTREQIYILDIECLYYIIRIAINKEKLMGEPIPGRRFRGITWLQGTVLAEKI